MRLWTIALLILFLLLLIPLAFAQEDSEGIVFATATPRGQIYIEDPHYNTPPRQTPTPLINTYIVENERVRLEDYIGGFGCPVGIRDANRDLLLDENGYILAGQTVIIPPQRDRGLCRIEYNGAIEFFEWGSYKAEHGYPNYIWEVEAIFNVCRDDLRRLNPRWSYEEMPIIRIPLDTAECFRTVELRAGQSPLELALELNICENLIWYYNNENIYEESDESR